MAVSLNDIKIKLHPLKIPVKLPMLCRWCLLLNSGKSEQAAKDFQVYAAKGT